MPDRLCVTCCPLGCCDCEEGAPSIPSAAELDDYHEGAVDVSRELVEWVGRY
jgi:hypothetical protein